MPPAKRVSDARVTEAITAWRGNVLATAEALGMSANSLRERLQVLGVDLPAIRRASAPEPAAGPVPQLAACPLVIRTSAREKRPLPVRILPAQLDVLRQAKFDLCARWRVETDEATILAQFMDEAFDPWLRSKMEPQA